MLSVVLLSLKMKGWICLFSFGIAYFPGAFAVSFRECYPPVNKHSNGKSPSWIGNTSSNGGIFHCYVRLPEGVSFRDCAWCPFLRPSPGAWSWPKPTWTTFLGCAPFLFNGAERKGCLKRWSSVPGDSSRDLFGMVKTWPFQGVKWPPTWGWKGHFESSGTWFRGCCFSINRQTPPKLWLFSCEVGLGTLQPKRSEGNPWYGGVMLILRVVESIWIYISIHGSSKM